MFLAEQIVSFAVPAASPSGIKASLMRTPGALRDGAACLCLRMGTVGTLLPLEISCRENSVQTLG